jgi:hypothetical protein
MASVALPLTPDGDVNKGPLILTVIWVEFSLAAAILGLRIWIRTRVIRFWGWDDVVMCLALVSAHSRSPPANFWRWRPVL